MPGIPPANIARICFWPSKKFVTSWETSPTATPEPLAMRARREPLMIFGSRRSCGVMDRTMASARSRSLSLTWESSSRFFWGAVESGHPVTRSARAGLAAAYLANAMPREAVEQYKRVLADTEAQRGRDHPETIAARASLAAAMLRAGKSRRGRLIVSLDAEVDRMPLCNNKESYVT